MKKRTLLGLLLAIAMVISMAAFAACGGDPVTVEIKGDDAVSIVLGETKKLSATTSDDSAVVWSTDNEQVATVDATGRVTAVKVGTANIKATSGEASDSVAVTVVGLTIKADGTAVTDEGLQVNMMDEVTFTLEATDSSTAATWRSSDESVATISSSGVMTTIIPGTTTVTVRTSSGLSKSVDVTVNALQGYQDITTESKGAGEWWYYTSSEGGRSTEVTEHYLYNNIVNFSFNGNGNWYIDDIQLGRVAPSDRTIGWKKLTGKITLSDIAETDDKSGAHYITIWDTTVEVKEGEETDFTVYYEQTNGGNDIYIRFAGAGSLIRSASVKLSNLAWADHTTIDALNTPSFTLTGSDVAITDTANTMAGSVSSYLIGLFADASATTPTATQSFSIDGGALDTSKVSPNGTYIVRIKAVANAGFNDSAWSTGNDVTYDVNNADITYTLETSGESGAQANSGTWTCWYGDGGTVAEDPVYLNGTVTLKSKYLGWAFYSVQLFYNDNAYAAGSLLKVTMNINASHAGHLTITGNVVELKAGNNELELYFANPTGATVSIQFGVSGNNPPVDFTLDESNDNDMFVFEISNLAIEEATATALSAPTFTVTDGNKVTITDGANEDGSVKEYQIGLFLATNNTVNPDKVVTAIAGENVLDLSGIKAGTYTVKVRALPSKAVWLASDWVVNTPADTVEGTSTHETYDLDTGFGGDQTAASPKVWGCWADQNWCGSKVAVSSANYLDGTVTITFTSTGTCTYGLQIHYTNNDTGINGYTFDVEASANMDIQVGSGDAPATSLVANTSQSLSGTGAHFYIQVNIKDNVGGTITISNVQWN